MEFEYKDYSVKVKQTIDNLAERAVEESCGEIESQTKRNTRVDTGQLKNSWSHRVVSSEDVVTGTVGSPLENAIWEEFGTGEYALNGDGRKGGWLYTNRHGETVFTRGKHPSRAFHKAYTGLKNKLIAHMQSLFKGGL